MKPVVTFGEIMIRLAPPGFERFLQSPQFLATFGGGEANVAVALAQFGQPSRFATVLPPANALVDAFLGELRRFGVDPSGVIRGKGRFGIYFVEPGANQRPSKVIYDRDYAAIALSKPGDIDWTKTFEGAGWFHITGITPALSQSAADLAIESVQRANAAGLKVSCDLNYRKNLWKYGKKPADVMAELFKYVHVGIANEEDCQMALGIAADSDVHSGKLDRDQYRKLTETVLATYPNLEVIGITLRESHSASHNGWSACLHDRKEFLLSKHYDITHIVDRVGGGDSFASGLIYGFLAGRDPQWSVECGAAHGALAMTTPGDTSMATLQEVLQVMKGVGARIAR